MCPNPSNGQPYQWEKDLAALDNVAKLDDIEEQANVELDKAIDEAIEKKKLSKIQAQQLRLKEVAALKEAISKQREKLGPQEQAAMDEVPLQNIPEPPNLPPNLDAPNQAVGGPPKAPKAPSLDQLNKKRDPQQVKAKIVSPQEEARNKAAAEKEEKRKQNLAQINRIKQEAKERALKADDTELSNLLKKTAEELKEVEAEIRTLDNKIIYAGATPLGRLARDSEPKEDGSPNDYDPIQGILKDIGIKKGEAARLQNALEAVQKNSRLVKIANIVERYQKAISQAKNELGEIEKEKDTKIAAIKKEVAEYKQKMEVLNQKKEQTKAVLRVYDDARKEKPEKVVGSKDPNAMVNRAAIKMATEIAKVENFSFEEQIILRSFFYDLNEKNPALNLGNALTWDNQTFETNLKSALSLGRLPYTNPNDPTKPGLKELIGRSVFEDDNNPVRVKKLGEAPIGKISPDLAAAIGANRPLRQGEAMEGAQSGQGQAPESSTLPKYQPPIGPQKDLSGEDTALKILKNIISSIVIKERYDRAGDKKSFVSLYLKRQNKDRPEQIQYLQNAVQNAANEIALLRGDMHNLKEDGRKERLESIFSKVTAALDKVEKDMEAAGHKKKGTSRMENVIANLRHEVSSMKVAVGLEKRDSTKKSTPS